MNAIATEIEINEEDRLRADMYNFLGLLLAGPPSKDTLAKTTALSGDDSPMGEAINTMARVAKATTVKAVESEFLALFIGLGRGELLPYTSFYLTGFLNEKPLALLRKDMVGLRISRAPNVYEPEDNIASLLEMMGGMITGRFGEPVPLDQQAVFFNKHIGSWAEHFFSDLEAAKSSVFYAPVGSAGKAFMEIEREAFRMDAA
jgi:TorA maturation chaperone TorD